MSGWLRCSANFATLFRTSWLVCWLVGLLIGSMSACSNGEPGKKPYVQTNESSDRSLETPVAVYPNTDDAMSPCQQAKEEVEYELWSEALAELGIDSAEIVEGQPVPAVNSPLIGSRFRNKLIALAEREEPCAYYGLGTLYLYGWDDVESNALEAEKWLKKGADAGHELSVAAYALL